jgi:hypothetical protein
MLASTGTGDGAPVRVDIDLNFGAVNAHQFDLPHDDTISICVDLNLRYRDIRLVFSGRSLCPTGFDLGDIDFRDIVVGGTGLVLPDDLPPILIDNDLDFVAVRRDLDVEHSVPLSVSTSRSNGRPFGTAWAAVCSACCAAETGTP